MILFQHRLICGSTPIAMIVVETFSRTVNTSASIFLQFHEFSAPAQPSFRVNAFFKSNLCLTVLLFDHLIYWATQYRNQFALRISNCINFHKHFLAFKLVRLQFYFDRFLYDCSPCVCIDKHRIQLFFIDLVIVFFKVNADFKFNLGAEFELYAVEI